MSRATYGAPRHKKKVRLLRAVKGFYAGRSKLHKTAREAIIKSEVYAFRDRKARKRDFRALWITRLTGACRSAGISYSRFIHGLKNAKVILNRKMMSELAIHDPAAFARLIEIAKQNLGKAAA
jgi:large subunit ribosomal protein L20